MSFFHTAQRAATKNRPHAKHHRATITPQKQDKNTDPEDIAVFLHDIPVQSHLQPSLAPATASR